MVAPAMKRQAVETLQTNYDVSERRAQRLVDISRGTACYRSQRDDSRLREALRRIAGERRRFGYRRLAIMLEREGEHHNLKKIYRLYREEGLTVKRRKGRNVRLARDCHCREPTLSIRSGR